jgi:hypothetical protein
VVKVATFAKDTSVSVDSTLQEIRKTLKRYQATNFTMQEADTHVIVAFEMCNRRVRFVLPLPQPDEVRVKVNASLVTRISPVAYEQSIRQKWRALSLTIKAKLESVQSGIETIEEAFMAQLVIADGRTMGEWAKPQIEQLYGAQQKMPPLLGSGQ